jgi:hypothetical protein
VDASTTKIIINALLVLHFLGIASLMAGFLTGMKQIKTGIKINAGVFHGSYLMLISGLAMAAMIDPSKMNVVVVIIKAIVLTVIFFIAYTYNKKENTPVWVVPTIFLLTLANIIFAIFGPVVNG